MLGSFYASDARVDLYLRWLLCKIHCTQRNITSTIWERGYLCLVALIISLPGFVLCNRLRLAACLSVAEHWVLLPALPVAHADEIENGKPTNHESQVFAISGGARTYWDRIWQSAHNDPTHSSNASGWRRAIFDTISILGKTAFQVRYTSISY